MKFSVVIPVYNSQDTILNTLLSVQNQTYKEGIEVIIIDDGSCDDSLKIIKKFIDKSNRNNILFKIIRQSNKGVSTARNKGMALASGEWIAFLDADDEWHPEKLQIMQFYLDDKYVILGHDWRLKEDKGIKLSIDEINCEEVTYFNFLIKNRFVTPSVIIKNNCGFFREEMNHAEDHEFWCRLLYKNRGLLVRCPLVFLNRPVLTHGGLSANRVKMRLGEINMYKQIIYYNKLFVFLYPFFIVFSLLKHFKQWFTRFFLSN